MSTLPPAPMNERPLRPSQSPPGLGDERATSRRPASFRPPRPDSDPPGSEPPPEEAPTFILRFGSAIAGAVLATAIVVMPAVLRVSNALPVGIGAGAVWAALSAAALAPMIFAVFVMRGARVGARAFGGEHAPAYAFGLALFMTTVFAALALFGAVLRATTHHHALAGATFAIVGGIVVVGCAIVAARIVALVVRRTPKVRRVLGPSIALSFVALLFVLYARIARTVAGEELTDGFGPMVVDLLAFAMGALFASRPSFTRRRLLAFVGPPAAALVFLLGSTVLARSPVLRFAIRSQAPALTPMVATFGPEDVPPTGEPSPDREHPSEGNVDAP